MTEQNIIEIYGKSIWSMTPTELIVNKLDELWIKLIDEGRN